MRYSQLLAFHNVAIHKGFSRAAKALFLTQPVISEHVRKLEQEYDVLLFVRERKTIKLTEHGKKLFLLTKHFFEVETQIDEFLSESRSGVEGTLRIIVDSAHHLVAMLSEFRAHHPNVFISLRTGNSQEVIEELRSYNADIGFIGTLSPGKDMVSTDLGSPKIVAFAAHDFLPQDTVKRDIIKMSLKEIIKYPVILREIGSKTRQKIEEEAKRQSIKIKPAIIADDREAIRELAASGAGIGFVSETEFGHDKRLVKIELTDKNLNMSETLIYLGQRRDVKLIRTFMKYALSSNINF